LYHLAIPSPSRTACSVPVLGLPALQQGDFNLRRDEQRPQRGVRDFEDQIALAVDSKSQVCCEMVRFCNGIIEIIFVGLGCLCWWFALNRKAMITGKVWFAFVYDLF